MGQQPWTQGSEGRNLMLWSQLKITEEEDEAKWSSKDELGGTPGIREREEL